MKRIVMLMVLAMMLVSLGGCFWGYEGHVDRGEGYGRGGGHDRGGERGEGHEERR